MNLKNSYHTYGFITVIFWSMAYVLTRLTLQHFQKFTLGFLRYFFASVALGIFVILTKTNPPQKKDIPAFILAGAFGFSLYMVLFNTGQSMVSASTGSVVIATVPVFTSLLARFIYKEKLFAYQWIAIGIEFVGVVVLTSFYGGLSFNGGIVWLIMAAFSLSFYNILQRKLTAKYTPTQTAAYAIFFGTIMLSVFLPGSIDQIKTAPMIQWVYIFIMGVFSSAIAYVTWSIAFTKAENMSQVSNYMFLTPFLTSILGFIIAKEVPDFPTILGGFIIMSGVFIYNFGGKFLKPKTHES